MSATDLAAIVVTVVCLLVVGVLGIAIQALVRTLRELRLTVDELRASTLPMVDDLQRTVNRAGDELERVDGVLDRAERITATVDVASRLGYRAFAPPVIKTLSVVRGTSRAAKVIARPRRRSAIDVKGHRR